jgi:NAD(P)H-dependent FMN reductase
VGDPLLREEASAIIGASPGAIGTAVAQQNLRDYMAEFREFFVRVVTVLPRQA